MVLFHFTTVVLNFEQGQETISFTMISVSFSMSYFDLIFDFLNLIHIHPKRIVTIGYCRYGN